MKKWMVIFLVAASLGSLATAHDVWLVNKGSYAELQYGHEIPEVYNPAKVVEYRGFDASGAAIALKTVPLPQSFGIVPDPKAVAVTVVLDNGYWIATSTSSEWKNVSLETARRFSEYSNPIKYHKSLYRWSDRMAKPLGLRFEIIPLKNPFTLKPGQSLPIQVLIEGKPDSGADVEYGLHGDKAPTVKTDNQGRASIPIQSKGEQFIAVDYKVPVTDAGEKLRTSYATSLRYELP